ncbi:type I polyketide synthase [Actinotalea fermentans ATCC 43279 = JCM 9966 = DSM 3133]|nr:type I polyketide synthase [Actinotalea fermentans ATCC 43279 = JCM 9966 = DSM 3133]
MDVRMTVRDVLEERARSQPGGTAYSFTESDGTRSTVTYRDLLSRVETLVAALLDVTAPGDRVLLLCDPSLGYVESFYAIVAAGRVAVPAYPAAGGRHADRVRRIVEDCRPAAVVADVPAPSDVHSLGLPAGSAWFNVNDVHASREQGGSRLEKPIPSPRPALAEDDLAFLQYTSGSTGSPKGVMVSHANLLSNAESARTTFGFHPGSVMVSWLPPFHDMGLIGCIITPLVVGFPCHLMAPSTFLRRPLKWLEAISELRATDSTAPNFAYRLCAERVGEADLGSLDLSSWTKAMNGAEPVSMVALNRFAEAYASTGFVPSSFRPCYGMAEATLLISGGHRGDGPPRSAAPLDAAGPEDFVSCGTPEPSATVRIVDATSRRPVPDRCVGEIWVSSPSVAGGYWNRTEATAATFSATTEDGDGPFLRTGDLGFLDGGELFVAGRIKDLLIVNGRNLYPQDLEDTVRASHPEFTGRPSAAFEHDGRIVVTVEAVPGRKVAQSDLSGIARAAAKSLSQDFEIAHPLVIVLRRGTLTTTSSGKIQRSAAQAAWREGSHTSRTIARSDTADATVPPTHAPAAAPQDRDSADPEVAQAEIREAILSELAQVTGSTRPPSLTTLLPDLGLDSVKVAALATAIEDRTGIVVPLSLAWEVDDVESYVAAVLQTTSAPRGSEPTEGRAPVPADRVVLVGAACRLPGGVTSPSSYWELLVAGPDRTGISPGTGRTGQRSAGIVPELAEFAPARFGIGLDEAAAMDPRQRLALTLAWEAIEDAAKDPRRLRGARIGVYLGGSDSEHQRGAGATGSTLAPGYRTTGAAGALLANRISYVLGLRGPSMVVDTACSSSLVAMDLALRALRSGDIDGALVGGVSALLDGTITETLAAAGMLSMRGVCSTFDEAADGYVRGEGGVMLYIERGTAHTSDALDPYCAILGSAVNQDGRSNGLTAPSGLAQQDVIRAALGSAGRSPEDIGYVEAHGTGTPLGDPVEVNALRQVLDEGTTSGTVWLGSTKAQIGHLEAAAGVAGLLRAALVVRAGVVPPQAEFRTPSTRIDWQASRLRVPTQRTAWDAPRRTAGVSSFGFGGTNAHVVVESVVNSGTRSPVPHAGPTLVRLSSETADGLRRQVVDIAGEVGEDLPVAALASALEGSRISGRVRAWTIAQADDDVRTVLERLKGAPAVESTVEGLERGAPTVALLASGHGAPIVGSLAGIYGHDPLVTSVLDSLGDVSELPLRVLLVNDARSRDDVRRTEVAQPAHFALAVSMGERLRAWGLEPSVVTGHSVGAYAAACLAGVFDRERGFALVSRRGELMEGTAEGGMLACPVGLEDARVIAAESGLDVAVANAPSSTVLSGTVEGLAAAEEILRCRGLRGTRLPVTRAFHSRLMRPVEAELARAVEAAGPRSASRATFVSDVDGRSGAAVGSPGYWTAHALGMIDFRASAGASAQCDVVVELGGRYLRPQIEANAGARRPVVLAALGRSGGMASLLEVAGNLWASGVRLEGLSRWSGQIPRLPTTVISTHTFPLRQVADVAEPVRPVPMPLLDPPVRALAVEHAARPYDLEGWAEFLCSRLSVRLDLVPDRIPRETGLFDLGLTSVIANDLREEVAALLGSPLSPTIIFDHPTISLLAAHLSGLGAGLPQAAEGRVPSPGAGGVAAAEAHGSRRTPEPVSVIGMACRFPGARTLAEFWSLVVGGGEVMSEPPADRWLDAEEARSTCERQWSERAGFLASDPAVFAADQFGISPREARSMDPQHRLLLEVTHEALGDAGITRDELRGARVGVWVGLSSADYAALRPRTGAPDAYAVTGNSPSLASGRIAHHLGVEGPAVTLDTACSSSLVACHEAVQALRAGTVDLALVGGVNLMLSARTTAALGEMGALSAAGRCSTFGADADGYARGEGCGVIVLRRQQDAHGRGDRIWCDVQGTSVNHDGVSAGLTVPSGAAQQRLIVDALRDAALSAHDVDYVEAHGTGTPLGDPIELEALAKVFDTGRDRPLPVSSVKAQIGHLEAAAGIAAFIKVGLMAGRGVVPTHPLGITPTPRFDWSSSRLVLPGKDVGGRPGELLTCGVSSFGFSGTNAHVVLTGSSGRSREFLPHGLVETPGSGPQLLLVSSETEDGLRRQTRDLADVLSDHQDRLDTVARSLAHRHDHATHRFATVAQDSEEAILALRSTESSALADSGRRDRYTGRASSNRRATWLFSGVGSEWKGMVTELLGEPSTRAHLAEADETLRSLGQPPLTNDQWHSSGRQEHLQPALTAVQVALAAQLRGLGGHRDEVIGYSAGTIAALVDTKWLDLDTGLRVAAWRGRVMDAASGSGATAACGLSVDAVREWCRRAGLDDVVVASVTGPCNCTVAGPVDQMARLERECRGAGVWWSAISHRIAFHHPGLEDVVSGDFDRPDVVWGRGDGTSVHLADGSSLEGLVADSARLLDDLWRPVDLMAVRRRLEATERPRTLVEVAPQPSVGLAMSEWPGVPTMSAIPLAVPGRNLARQLRRVAAALWVQGADTTARLPLSTAPLHGTRYWWHDDQASERSEETGPDAKQAGYRLRWMTENQPPQRCSPRPTTWVVAADADLVAARTIRDAVAARGFGAETLTWVEAANRSMDGGAGRGVIVDATDAPDPRSDAGWHGRLLGLLQTLGRADSEVWVVTRGATTAGGSTEVGSAAVWGLGRALSTEHPEWWGGAVDLSAAEVWSEEIAARVVAEALDGGTEDQVAFRGGARRVPRLVRVPRSEEIPVLLDGEASYMVTGGSGTLGRRMVRWLVDRGARHLVLAARSNERTQRERLALLVDDLEARGAQLYFVEADVADLAQLERVVATTDGPWPPVRGVLHLAGHMCSGPFSELTPEDLRASWEPKAGGALALEDISRRHPLDFVVLFSSASSVWGSAMAGAYVSANYALDVIAERAAANGLPFMSANWSWWPDTAMADGVHEYFSRMGLGPVDETAGWDAMDRLVGQGDVGLVVAPIDWSSFRPVMAARRPRPMFDAIAHGVAEHSEEGAADHDVRTEPWNRSEIEDRLTAALRAILGTDRPIDPRQGFFDMGVDSIMTLELKRDIESWSGERLHDAFLFEYPRLTDLTEALLQVLVPESDADSAPAPECPGEVPGSPARPSGPTSGLDDLATDELLLLLEQELGSAKGPGHD